MASTAANIYVAGLPSDFDDAALRGLFNRFGAILSTKFFPRPGSVGYGFVNFGSPAAAQAAINAMDGTDFRGVALQARLAGQGAGVQNKASGGYPGSAPSSRANVYVAGWPAGFDEAAFRKAFEPFGKIVSSKLCFAKSQGGRVYGFVNFEAEAAAHKAIHAMNGAQYGGVDLQVRIASNGAGEPELLEGRVLLSNERLFGTLDAWKGKYGWILPKKAIKHATAVMHNGRVFLHPRDLEGASEIKEGDAVSFLAYTDSDGLGAAAVRLEEHPEQAGSEREAGHESVSSSSRPTGARGPNWRRRGAGNADVSVQAVDAGVLAAEGTADIYVKGWPVGLSDADFRQVFEQFGPLVSLDLRVDQAPGNIQTSKRVHGYARFSSSSAAESAVEAMDGVVYGGVPLQVCRSGDGASPSSPSAAAVVEPGLQMQVRVGEERYFGKVVLWKGKFGWISPERRIENIDNQPLVRAVASRHHGRIYVNERDIEGATELSAGDRVSFVAYADWDGLGASEVRKEAIADPALVRREVRTRIRSLAAPHISGNRRGASNAHGATGNGYAGANGSSSSHASVNTSAGGAGAPASSPAPPAAWWHALAGDCCAISLTPFEELEQEPFGLLATAEASEELQDEGLWGAAAVAVFYSMQAVHWFHGLFLACSLVSSVQFLDPVSMRPLSRGECTSLDRYLAFHNFPAVHVTEAFDLGRQVATAGDGSRSDASERLAALGRDAASVLRIFDEGEAPPAAETVTSSNTPANSQDQDVRAASDTAASPKAHSPTASRSCTEAAAAHSEASATESAVVARDSELPMGALASEAPEAGTSPSVAASVAPSGEASPESATGVSNAKEGGRRRRWQK